MISIITGTLNRRHLLPGLISNTILSNDQLELILVDGGSTDGTIEYIQELNHPRIKIIEVGQRSPYPHYMNLAIKNATHEIVCQWNDDVILLNDWKEIISEIDNEHDFYLFNWKEGTLSDTKNPEWVKGNDHSNKWYLLNNIENPVDGNDEIVMNYGLYKKDIFRKIGMYNDVYGYYYADADMANRAYRFGFKVKTLRNIKVCSLSDTKKQAFHYHTDEGVYQNTIDFYKQNILPNNIELLK
jgi:glycosyltransferase involved in cell wall biosynthesis